MTDNETKNKKGSFLDRNWSWLAAMLITEVFMLTYMCFLNVAPFGYDTFTLVDSIHQYIPFLSDYQDKLLHGKSLLYTWDVGLGQNFQSLFLYYMASPLNLIIVFFPRKNIVDMFSLLVSVKIAISSGLFAFMLSRRNQQVKNNMIITALSFCYALSAYMCGYYWNIMWLDCIMVFPLIIMGFERLMTKNDPKIYILSLCYCLYCNYYISFMICAFLVLWFLATGHRNFKGFIFDGLKFAGASILAALMSAFSLLMAYLAIMKTASAGSALPENNWYQNIFELIKRHFILLKPVTMDTYDGSANLYAGIIVYVLFFVYLFSKNVTIFEKIRKLLLVTFLMISMNQELLNFIWHGFHNQFGIPNRFAFLYIFTLIYMAYDVISDIRNTGAFSIVAGVILAGILLGVTYYRTDMEGVVPELVVMIVSCSLIILYTFMLLLAEEKKLSSISFSLIMFFLIAGEIFTNAWMGIADHGSCDGGYYMQDSDRMQKAVTEVEHLAETKGKIFYRSDVVSPIMLDENTYDNMKSVGTFCTTVRGDMIDAMCHMGFYTGSNEYLFLGSNPVTNDLLGVRYIYLKEGDYYPSENDYPIVYNSDGVRVLENKNAMSIGYGVSENVDEWETGTYNSADVINDFAAKAANVGEIFEDVHPAYAVTGENCTATYSSDSPDLIYYGESEGDTIAIDATMIAPEDGRYIINIRANYLENIIYYLNDVETASGRYQTQLFDLGELKAGDIVRLKLEFSTGYSPEGTVSMFLSTLNKDNLSRLRGELQKHEMVVTELTDNSVRGNVYMDKNQVLLTTIPYDEGWIAYVDGEKWYPEETGDGFICLWLNQGEHDVELRFTPEGMMPGIVVSISGWVIFIILIIVLKRLDKTDDKTDDKTEEKIDDKIDDKTEKLES